MTKQSKTSTEQKVLKTIDKVDIGISKFVIAFLYLLPLVFFAMSAYYGIQLLRGYHFEKQLMSSLECTLGFSAICAFFRLLDLLQKRFYQKDYDFDPSHMELPTTITLEDALHTMALKKGMILWDTLFGFLIFFFVVMLLCVRRNVFVLAICCLVLSILLGLGHIFWRWHFHKQPLTKKLIRITSRCYHIPNPDSYAVKVDHSLRARPLYVARELILTNDYMLGIVESDIHFLPVALPREQITCLTFYCKRPVSDPYHKYDMGILKCTMAEGMAVELLIGQGPRMERVLKVLNYYHIEWQESETIYE